MPVSPLKVDQVRRIIPEGLIHCKSTAELKSLDQIIGQERAVRALQFGLDFQQLGYNIYVAGMPGTGRTTAVRGYLEELAKTKPKPNDCVYVNNFEDPYKPNVITLPPGMGRRFVSDLKQLVDEAKRIIPKAIESDDFNQAREKVIQTFEAERRKITEKVNKKAKDLGFAIQATQAGIGLIPLINGKPATPEEYNSLDDDTKLKLAEAREKISQDVRKIQRTFQEMERDTREKIEEIGKKLAIDSIDFIFSELATKYQEVAEVKDYLEATKEDMGNNLELFLTKDEEAQAGGLPVHISGDRKFRKYFANQIVDHEKTHGAPVIVLQNSTYKNLFGFIEREAVMGALFTDFTMIHGGALHEANGGFLVLPIEGVLLNNFVYDGIKRALRNEKIEIEDIGERYGLLTTKTLAPEPIPLNIKLVLIGDPMVYQQLYMLDPDFRELFKVKADFDTTMEWSMEHLQLYASFVCGLCNKENLLHLDSGGLSKLFEHSARLAQRQTKLSTRFGEIADIIREANFFARKDNSTFITAKHIKKAIDEKFYRSNLYQSKILENIENGTIKIAITGTEIGQANGLSVLTLGDVMFGQPSRVTASVALGKEGIVNIEREAELSGPIHTKGVLILNGFLADHFARDYPLTLSARLGFEQSYGMIDGDSASSTELYALLSRLANAPIRQQYAITGSVNQRGEVQAIGGVNEKIEGFFEVCKAKGLTGDQGVLIPESNVKDLMLKDEVVEAVRKGKFSIFPITSIKEGIEVLTGIPAGERDAQGKYPPETIFGRVDLQLRYMAQQLKEYSGAESSH